MKVLLIGSGGREHAMAWKLAQSPKITKLLIAPGNAGTAEVGTNVNIGVDDHAGIIEFANKENVDLVVVAPDQPIVDGLCDQLRSAGITTFGPSAAAARIEGSKIWADDLMTKYSIPTAQSVAFSDSGLAMEYGRSKPAGSLVVKADGLAAGKGVILPETNDDLDTAIIGMLDHAAFGESSSSILLAERMTGPEASVFAFVDGEHVSAEIATCDYKRIGEGDVGLNTGGMGAYGPPEFWNAELAARVRSEILEPIAKALVAENSSFSGVIYAGLMITEFGPKIVEFNCRFGDPETQILMPMLESDLLDICHAVAENRLSEEGVVWSTEPHTFVVAVSGGYPGSYPTGFEISGIENASEHGVVFHAGTKTDENGALLTSGGRVLGVSSSGDTIKDARTSAYAGIENISFEGMQYRRDIAERAVQD
ncbi:MAG: phosphoribosylamine--glycine ligase [Chloroflexi bacterium]|nr:phosphoribosylamine--glycine ligase [Chloroflexota bacterium]